MGKKFTYEGGPRDKEISQAEESDFPQIHPGGEYRASGFSRSQFGTNDDAGMDDDQATAIWHPTAGEQ